MHRMLLFLLLAASICCPCTSVAQESDPTEPTGLDYLKAARAAEAEGYPMRALFLAGKAAGFSSFVDVTDEEYPPLLAAGTAEHAEALGIVERNKGSLLWSSPTLATQYIGCIDKWYPECIGVEDIYWSPDNSRIVANGMSSNVKIVNVETGEILSILRGGVDSVLRAFWSQDGAYIYVNCLTELEDTDSIYPLWINDKIRVYNAETYAQIFHSDENKRLIYASFCPENTLVAMTYSKNEIEIWNYMSNSLLFKINGNTVANWSHDGSRMVTWGGDECVRIWDMENGDLLQTLDVPSDVVQTVYWARGDERLVLVSESQEYTLCGAENGDKIQVMFKAEFGWTALSPDGEAIATWGGDTPVTLWSTADGSTLCVFPDTENAQNVLWERSGMRIACDLIDRILVYDAMRGNLLSCILDEHRTRYISGWSPDGRYLCVDDWRLDTDIIDLQTGEIAYTIRGTNGPNLCMAWSSDSSIVADGDISGYITFYRIGTGMEWHDISIPEGNTLCIDWSSDGQRIVSGGRDGIARIWSADDGSLLSAFESNYSNISSIAWSSDDSCIAMGHSSIDEDDGMYAYPDQLQQITIWDINSLSQINTIPTTGGVFSLSWDPSNHYLAAGHYNSTSIYDVESNECIKTFAFDDFSEYDVSWSPNGTYIAASDSFSKDAVHIWNVISGDLVADLEEQREMSWGTDGVSLATLEYSGDVNIWNIENGTLVCSIPSTGGCESIAWSPTGNHVGVACGEMIYIINVNDTTQVQTLESPLGWYGDISWSQDGTRLARDGVSIGVWDISNNAQGKFNSDILRYVQYEGAAVRFLHPVGNIGEALSIRRQ